MLLFNTNRIQSTDFWGVFVIINSSKHVQT